MERIVLVVGAVLVAALVAAVLGRRPDRPASNTHNVPRLLDRLDFDRPEAPWLVAVFTSATCNTCAGVLARARPLESADVAVQELEVGAAIAIHERYKIDAVPTLVIADTEGEVQRAFLGPVSTTELWAALAEARA